MDTVRFVVGVVLPYIAIAVFLVGMVYHLFNWKRLPSPPMTLYPAGSEPGSKTANIMKEAFFFRSLFKGDRFLWVIAWGFHIVLALIFLGHLRVFFNLDALLMKLGMSEAAIGGMSSAVGGAAGVLIFLAALLLIARRMAIPRVREITSFADYGILILLAAVIVTGNLMRFGGGHVELSETRAWFASLATFSGASSAAVLQNGTFVLHMALAMVLIMLIPFSKVLHVGGIFFTQYLVRKA